MGDSTQRSTPSIQQILQQRSRNVFVGRGDAVARFCQNLSADASKQFIFNVHGQGGVGKSSLIRRFRDEMDQRASVTAYVNEDEVGVIDVMSRIAEQFREHGERLKEFESRYEDYRKLQHEVESDPDMPQGLSAVVTRILVGGGLKVGKRAIGQLVPGSSALLDEIDENAIAEHADEARVWLTKKLGNRSKDDIQLVRQPIETLTPLFINGIRTIGNSRHVGLFFDTYEHTSVYLDEWLRAMFDPISNRFGELPSNLVVVIAGRQAMDSNDWIVFEPIIEDIHLDIFDAAESRQFLNRKGITDEETVKDFTRLSGGLPLLLATLAANPHSDSVSIGEPSETALERFLRWTDNKDLRALAIDAALLRTLNVDVLASLQSVIRAEDGFEWLKSMPFIMSHRRGWRYHDTVRTQFIRYKRRHSPAEFSDYHRKLTEYYASNCSIDDIGPSTLSNRPSERAAIIESIYHGLCAEPYKGVSRALSGFISAFEFRPSFARTWALAIKQAGDDIENGSLRDWGDKLTHGVNSFEQRHYEKAIEMFSALQSRGQLNSQMRTRAMIWSARLSHLAGHNEQALQFLSGAIEASKEAAACLAERAEVHYSMGHFMQAFEDISGAIARSHRQYERQLWLTRRGYFLLYSGNARGALDDAEDALNISSEGPALELKVRALHYLDRNDEASGFLEAALSHISSQHVLYEQRGSLLYELARYEDAIEAYNAALETVPTCAYSLAGRARARVKLGQLAGSLEDYNAAIRSPDVPKQWLAGRAALHSRMGNYDAAVAEYKGILERHPESKHSTREEIGYIRLRQNDYLQAAHEFEIALAAYPECARSWIGLAHAYHRQVSSHELTQSKLASRLQTFLSRQHSDSYIRACYAAGLSDIGLSEAARAAIRMVRVGDLVTINRLEFVERLCVRLSLFSQAADCMIASMNLGGNQSDNKHTDIGLTLSYAHRYREALTYYLLVKEEDPSSYAIKYDIAVVIARWHGLEKATREIAEARDALQLALSDEGSYRSAKYGIAGLEALAGRTDDALELLKDALSSGSTILKKWARNDIAFEEMRHLTEFQTIVT